MTKEIIIKQARNNIQSQNQVDVLLEQNMNFMNNQEAEVIDITAETTSTDKDNDFEFEQTEDRNCFKLSKFAKKE